VTRFGDTKERRVPINPGALRAETYSLVKDWHEMTDEFTVTEEYHRDNMAGK
jgi:hypothetical protein